MRDVLGEVERWRESGERVAIATVIQTWGSAPRPAGSAMALTAGGKIAGSVSAGCVEAAVVERGLRCLETHRPERLRFGVSDETAWSVGLACGGQIDLFVEPLADETLDLVRAAVRKSGRTAVATVVGGAESSLGRRLVVSEDGAVSGSVDASLDAALVAEIRNVLAEGESRMLEPNSQRTAEVFVDVLQPPPQLIVVGGVHIAMPLVAIAKVLGYRTVVVDPREAFGSKERFPDADRLVSAWPDEALEAIGLDAGTAVVVLTHDPKLDDPALAAALRSPAFYVGALGSRGTQEKRRSRLRAGGLDEELLERLHAPVGLPIGGRSPQEIALSIMAEIVGARNERATSSVARPSSRQFG